MLGRAKILVIFLSALFVAYGLVGGMLDQVSARDDTYRDLSIFTDVLSKVKEDYVEEPDLERAVQGALHGMMEALDPYSSFIDRDTYREIEGANDGLTASPGVILCKRYGYAYIVSVVPGSPAEREGLRTGDLLESIDGRVTTQISLWEARKLLIGKEGSSVNVRLIRARRSAPSQVELVRKDLPLPEVSARILEDGIGFLWIPHFGKGVAKVISSKLKMLQSVGMRGLLVDVRGTALGVLQEAVHVSDFFLPKGEKILTVRDRNETEREFFSLTESMLSDIPIVLLIDGGTSGPAEVFVAALKDHSVAETVGRKTNGQGSEQALFHLEDGSVLQISKRLFYRATEEAIQSRSLKDSGISPDVRYPNQDFVTNFYFENTPDDPESTLGEEFYRKLNEAIRTEQFKEGLKQLRNQLLREAA